MNELDNIYYIRNNRLRLSDQLILNSFKTQLPGIVAVFGPNCVASLHSAEDRTYPCIAVENGQIDDIEIGTPLSAFAADAVSGEAHHGGKNMIGLYYSKTPKDHAIKCVINLIRNENLDLIGCLCISIDVSVPLHEFMRSFIPVVDNKNLAEGLSEPIEQIDNVSDLIHQSIAQAIEEANSSRGLSATNRNRLIVQQLQENGIFTIRGAIGMVANELGVSRYTIYNYLKDGKER